MKTFTLRVGLCILKDERLYRFVRTSKLGVPIFEDEDGVTLLIQVKEFFRLFTKGEITVPDIQPTLGFAPVRKVASPDLSCYRDTDSKEALQRMKMLNLILNGESMLPSNSDLESRIKEAGKQIDDLERLPSISTVRRWFHAWRASGGWAVGLLPAHRNKGRHKVIAGEVEDIVDDVLHQLILVRERTPVGQAFIEIKARIDEINQYRPTHRRINLPSQSTIYRYLRDLDPIYVSTARNGKHATKREFRMAIGMVHAKNVNDRWEIDHTPIDVLLVDEETGEVIGRPWLTVVIDRFSRMIVSFVLHLLPPTMETVLLAIERAITPKQAFLERFPEVKSDWPAHGFPMRLVPDNGAEFHARGLMKSFAEMGVEVLFPPSRSPKHKATVERFFRTLCTGLIHGLPGTTFSNTRQRGDYPAEELACFTFRQFEKVLTQWIVDVYHNTAHRGLYNKTPLDRWKESQITRTIHLPRDLDDLEAMLSARAERTLHHYGVEISGIKYNSIELQRIANRAGQTDRIEVRYRDELGHVWIKDSNDEIFICVPSVDCRYAGMSRDIYEAARIEAKKRGLKNPSFEKMAEACRGIRKSIEDAKTTQKMRGRKHAAAVKLKRDGSVREEVPNQMTSVQMTFPDLDFGETEIPVFNVKSVSRGY